ncbi:glycosyltransferase family 4 protein [Sporosarcina koreensis]|uniref:Glycosyltransferase family 4 protein n=1 Tax=Sporosarcina koreensis TaxID=334735 RepID=A0ABW0U2L9_9BACL
MRVLFVASIFGHITAFHIPFIKLLKSKGYEVWVACNKSKSNSMPERDLENLGVKCITIDFTRSPFTLKTIKALSQLRHLLKYNDFNLIHVHTPTAALLTRFINSRVKKNPIIYTAHGFHFFRGAPLRNWFIYFPLERMAAKWTNKIITINKEDYKRAKKIFKQSRVVSYVQGVGVESFIKNWDKEEKITFKKGLGIPDDSIVITYIAEINKNKNHYFLLRNWKEIKKSCPKSVLLIVGDGNKRTGVEQFILDEQLVDVHLLGYRNDIDKILEITDVVTLLSYREGLPKSIMEAMAAGLPCVVSDTRGLRDLITDGHNGYVIPHNDDSLLIRTFVTLLNDESLRHKLGKASLLSVEPYKLENVLKEYEIVYNEILESR